MLPQVTNAFDSRIHNQRNMMPAFILMAKLFYVLHQRVFLDNIITLLSKHDET